MNESDYVAKIDALSGACNALTSQIKASRMTVPSMPMIKDDCIGQLDALQKYHAMLVGILSGAKPATSSAVTAPAPLTLTDHQISFLRWPERVALAQNRITQDQALALIAPREQEAAAKKAGATLTDRVLAKRGVTSVAQLTSSASRAKRLKAERETNFG